MMATFINSVKSLMGMEKRGIVADYLPWLLIALAVLAILFGFIFVLRGEGASVIDRIKNLFGGI